MTDPVFDEIRDLLKSIDGKLTPRKVEFKSGNRFKPGRVFSRGQNVPSDVDLVAAPDGVRWRRLWNDSVAGRLPTEWWTPRDIDGTVRATNDLLTQYGHVTEVPAPDSEATP